MTALTLYHLGLVEYPTALDLQRRLAEQIAAGQRLPALFLLQHPHVYTFGRQGSLDNLLWDEAELADKGIAVQWTDRGGDVTYHGPGQLVGYPLIPLPGGVLEYLRQLEQVLIEVLAGYGLPAIRVDGQTGVWVPGSPPAKIASIGVRVDARGITRHGFALNVNPDMRYWDGIVACGLENQQKTSMADHLSETPDMSGVVKSASAVFSKVFDMEIQISNPPKVQNPDMKPKIV